MQITHNEVTAGLWLVVSASGVVMGRLIRWRRHLRELDDAYDDGYDRGWDDAMRSWSISDSRDVPPGRDSGPHSERWSDTGSTPASLPEPGGTHFHARRTVVLEPGPTIYPALAALAQDPLDGPESHAEPSDSTWLYKILLDWENRYPIHQDSPSGRMAEAI